MNDADAEKEFSAAVERYLAELIDQGLSMHQAKARLIHEMFEGGRKAAVRPRRENFHVVPKTK